jgi:hypothetical protein
MGVSAELALVKLRDVKDDLFQNAPLDRPVRIDALETGEGAQHIRIHGKSLNHLCDGQPAGEQLGAFLKRSIAGKRREVLSDA